MAGLPNEYQALEEVLGNTLVVRGYQRHDADGEQIRQHMAELDLLPKPFLSKLKREGLKGIEIRPGSVVDFPSLGLLPGAHPPGYPEGTTYRAVPAIYNRESKTIFLGSRPKSYRGTALHEIFHAAGNLLGYDDDFRVRQAYARSFERLEDFYKDRGGHSARGRREFFADSAANVIMETEEAVLEYGRSYVEFVLDHVLKGRTGRTK